VWASPAYRDKEKYAKRKGASKRTLPSARTIFSHVTPGKTFFDSERGELGFEPFFFFPFSFVYAIDILGMRSSSPDQRFGSAVRSLGYVPRGW
jgi:hypothetical protein